MSFDLNFDSSLNFKGRVAIVTGAGGGLGRQHALALATRGTNKVGKFMASKA